MPDLAPSEVMKAGGLTTCKNVVPANGYYQPVLDKSTFNSTAYSGTALNGIMAKDANGAFYNFFGTSTKLYRFDKTNMTDITRAVGGAYSAGIWNFVEYGEWLIATDYTDVPQVLKGFGTANYVALGGSPPKSKYCLMNNGHLVFAFVNDGSARSQRIQWSAREATEDWIASLLTGAGYQDAADIQGPIKGIGAIGSQFVIAGETSLSIGHYVGGVDTYAFIWNAIRNIGCYYPQSMISIGDRVFFWSRDNIYSFDGSGIKEIGGKLKNTVVGSINTSFNDRITCVHDGRYNIIAWAYPNTLSTTGASNRILVYNYVEDRAAEIHLDCDMIMLGNSGQITIADLTMPISAMTIPFGSSWWLASTIQMLLANPTDSKMNKLGGAILTAELETGELSDLPSVLQVQKVYSPLSGSGLSGNVSIKHRYDEEESFTVSSSSAIKSDNTVDVRTSNRFLSVNLTSSSFTKINNKIEAEIVSVGRR